MSNIKTFIKGLSRRAKRLIVILSLTISALAAISFTAGDFEIVKNLDIFASAIRQLNQNYVDPINPGELTKNAIEAMLRSLDPYTNYIAEADIEDYRFMTTGQYGGIGAEVRKIGNDIVISEPYENYAAHKAGLMAGDVILEVNGRNIQGRSLDEVGSLMKGQSGTTVVLTIRRQGESTIFTKEIVREEVKVENIPWHGMLDDNTGYIKLAGFTMNAGKEVRDAFVDLKAKNPEITGLILDLRGNGGGLLHEAVNIVNLFVDKGFEVVSTRGRVRERNQVHKTLNPPLDKDIRLVVMMDERSASASEIVAGAIQDLDRGIVVGRTTFGKGLVQNVVPLSYNAQMKVTVAKYYIPSGRCVQAIDYSRRNAEGKAVLIPDSLRTAFKTSKGRIVYDGHGIDPDVYVPAPKLARVTQTLISDNHLFHFANDYRLKVNEIPAAELFDINEELYSGFLAFLSGKSIEYETESEKMLGKFREASEKEGYFKALEESYNGMKGLMQKNKQGDLQTFRPEISSLLRKEIVQRYFFQKGVIVSSLNHDPEIAEALKIINDPEAYRKLLAPGVQIRHAFLNPE